MEPRPPRPHPPGEPTRWSDEPSLGAASDGTGPPPRNPRPEAYLPPSFPPYPYSVSEGPPPPEPRPPGDRRRVVLGSIFAVIALLIVAALVLFAVDRGRNGDNNRKAASAAQTATRSSELFAVASAHAILTRAAAVPTATATPVATPIPTQPPATPTAPQVLPTVPVPSPAPASPTPVAQPKHAAHIADMLPTDNDVPKGLVQISNGQRSLADAAQSFTDPSDATQKLQSWSWQGNVYRSYGVPDGVTPDPNATTFIDVSIHRFGNAASAEAALAYFAGDVTTSQGLHSVNVPLIGDHDVGLAGAPNQANLVIIYVQRDSILYRIAASSPTGDPTNDVIAVAKKVVAK